MRFFIPAGTPALVSLGRLMRVEFVTTRDNRFAGRRVECDGTGYRFVFEREGWKLYVAPGYVEGEDHEGRVAVRRGERKARQLETRAKQAAAKAERTRPVKSKRGSGTGRSETGLVLAAMRRAVKNDRPPTRTVGTVAPGSGTDDWREQ